MEKSFLFLFLFIIIGLIKCDKNPESVEKMPIAIAGTLTNASSIRYVQCEVSGDYISGSDSYEMDYNQSYYSYGGSIMIPIEGEKWELTIMAKDAAERTTGYKIVEISNDSGVILIPPFNARNAVPLISVSGNQYASYNDTVTITCVATDNFGGTVKIECDIGNTGNFTSVPGGKVTIITTPDMTSPYVLVWKGTDNDGNVVTKNFNIYIRLFPPVADAGNDTNVSINDTIRLQGDGIDTNGIICDYAWKIGATGDFISVTDGDTTILGASVFGTYYNILRVTDDDGNTNLDTMQVIVKSFPPLAEAGKDTVVSANTQLALDGNATDNGTIVEYAWKFGDNSQWVVVTYGDTTITVTDESLTLICSLRVIDDDGEVGYDALKIGILPTSKMQLIQSKGKTFQIGNVDGGPGSLNFEIPVHNITFTYNYYIDITEVTRKDYGTVLDIDSIINTNPNHPIILNYYDAVLYLNAKSKQSLLDTVYAYTSIEYFSNGHVKTLNNFKPHLDQKGFRFPTEAEWEYACRGGTTTDYFWGNDSSSTGDYAWYKGNSGDVIQEVGKKLPNGYDLYDICGNAREWCNDYFDYYKSGDLIDPLGPSVSFDPDYEYRVGRSGDYRESCLYIRPTRREPEIVIEFRSHPMGFRCVLNEEIPDILKK